MTTAWWRRCARRPDRLGRRRGPRRRRPRQGGDLYHQPVPRRSGRLRHRGGAGGRHVADRRRGRAGLLDPVDQQGLRAHLAPGKVGEALWQRVVREPSSSRRAWTRRETAGSAGWRWSGSPPPPDGASSAAAPRPRNSGSGEGRLPSACRYESAIRVEVDGRRVGGGETLGDVRPWPQARRKLPEDVEALLQTG